jgi:phosphonate transport system permease protein
MAEILKMSTGGLSLPEGHRETAVTISLPQRHWKKTILYFLCWVVGLSVLAWAWEGSEMRPLELIRHSPNMLIFLKEFFPPDMHQWPDYLSEMLVTVQIAIWGTVLAVVLSVPLGILCAHNISPLWVRQPIRRLMDALRAVNEMVFALLFVAAVGLGPFSGVLALFVHTLGTLAKLFSEAVEAIDPRPVEGIRATGAHVLEEIFYGVIPQVMPLWISYSLYRFEANVRSATVVGMVGAGGIGLLLWDAIRNFAYANTAAMLIIIIICVSLLDVASAALRKVFI